MRTIVSIKWFAFRWGPALLMMAAIFVLSGTPDDDLPSLGGWEDVITSSGHALGYALLAGAFLHALTGRRAISLTLMTLAVALAIAYGVSDEYHQSFVPGRTPDGFDMMVDGIGAVIGVAACRALRLRRAPQRSE